MEKTLSLGITTIAIAALIVSVAAVYYTATLRNTGTIVAHGCKIYLDDKTTESYTIAWGEMRVNQTLTNYRWVYNNSTVTNPANLTWHHNAPAYFTLKMYYQLPNLTWQELTQGQQTILNQTQWLHTRFELTTQPDAINHQGAFAFDIFIELA
jgi:alpha-tubulin suppressor-like RCC1 family protein